MENEQIPSGNINIEQTAINAKELLWKYFRYSWLFILTLGLSLTAAWVYLRYTKPVYNVAATLLIRNDNANRQSGGMNSQDMFSDIALFQSNSNKQNEILILSSRSMMERVVKALDIQKRYAVVGTVKTLNIYNYQPFELIILSLSDSSQSFEYTVHFSEDWKTFQLGDSKEIRNTGQDFVTSEGKFRVVLRKSSYITLPFRNFTVSWMPLQDAAISYTAGLEVKPANDLSNVLQLSYTDENPKLSSAILNELMQQYNDAAIQDKNEINRKILAFINDRLQLVENQLDTVEGNLQKYRTRNKVIDLPAQSEMYFNNLNQTTESTRIQENQLQIAQLLEDYLQQPANRMSLVPSTLGLTDPTFFELTNAYNRLVGQRLNELQTGATPNNPIVKNLESEIEQARIKMLKNLENIKQAYRGNLKMLKSQTNAADKEISSIPERERQTKEKGRQQEIKQNLYLYLMQKREESEIAQASTIANSRILDTALPISRLVSPIPFKIYGISLLIGLIIPIVLIYFRDILNDKVTVRADITKNTNAPVLAEIGHSDEDRVILFPQASRTIVAEQMRILRSNLRFVLGEKFENPTILVTSSFSGEGKSFISTNLGATLAISGRKTVILEFDLRKPKIMVGLGLQKGHGLTNFLIGGTNIEDIVQPVDQIEGLFVIPCGPVPPNPSEILLSPKIKELFSWLKTNFEAIVIDTAPAGLVSDAFTLSQYADSTIYVVRQRYTFKRQIGFIDELYVQSKLPRMGILVNDVTSKGSKSYYGYGNRSYGYGYGYGQEYLTTTNARNKSLAARIKNLF